MSDFTHFNEQGRAKMVDVGEKPVSQRVAVAAGRVLVNEATFALIRSGGMKKGDVLTVAQIAGVMGAKRTPDIIPMCHPILMDGINLELSLDEEKHSVEIKATVSCDGRTGVEMEALTADAKLKPCLHSADEYSIKGLNREEMKAVFEQAIWNKPAWHGDLDAVNRSKAGRNMNEIGG